MRAWVLLTCWHGQESTVAPPSNVAYPSKASVKKRWLSTWVIALVLGTIKDVLDSQTGTAKGIARRLRAVSGHAVAGCR